MTKIYLIRHGESIGNASRIYLGHTDWDLSPFGYLQAEETAKKLSDVPFSAVYSSDLQRAVHTAEPHAKRRGLEVVRTAELREINVGEWEGAKVEDLLLDERFINGWRENFGLFTCPGGENVGDASERIYSAIAEIAKKHDGEAVAVVFHAAALRAFWCKIQGLPKDKWASVVSFPTNASYSVVEYEGGKFEPKKYSCDEHLHTATKQP
ncbi:MAG: histidine phosphatase family protein [Clostridia bacterium]|nr:histidine phosphatase family protein [Clostridia bacterium]